MKDLHTEAAMTYYGVTRENVTRKMRSTMKARAFGRLYASGSITGRIHKDDRPKLQRHLTNNVPVQAANAEVVDIDTSALELRLMAQYEEKK